MKHGENILKEKKKKMKKLINYGSHTLRLNLRVQLRWKRKLLNQKLLKWLNT